MAPGNGRRSNIKCNHLKASMGQLLSIITKTTPNNEGELSFALNVSVIKPLDEVGITDHLSPVESLSKILCFSEHMSGCQAKKKAADLQG